MAQKFYFSILRIEVTPASRGLSEIAELLVSNWFHRLSTKQVDLLALRALRHQNSRMSFHVGLQKYGHQMETAMNTNEDCVIELLEGHARR